jgi:plastocyanin
MTKLAKRGVAVGLLMVLMTAGMVTSAAAEQGYRLTIREHRFIPEEIEVPANQKIELVVVNEDATAEEFESKSLHREKVIKGGATATIALGPLKPGTYEFVGEFHEDTAKGRVVVK